LANESIPESIPDEESLEELLSRPDSALSRELAGLGGDLVILGAGGKIGPTLSRMAQRAAPGIRITAVSRFSDPTVRRKLEKWGIETLRGDLLDRAFLRSLPEASNVVFMAGMKFGTKGNEPLTWAQNVYLPALAAEKYRQSRIVVFSTGNVYPFRPADSEGPSEEDAVSPVGEYAQSCLGRERIFQYFAREAGTRVLLFRLNYACELRYGVLVDIATSVFEQRPVDLSMGYVNVIWQGTATGWALRSLSLAASPAAVLNCAGPKYAVRELAGKFGEAFGKIPRFQGTEAETALLSCGRKAQELFGPDPVPLDRMVAWIARWIRSGLPRWSKPTHFQEREGTF